VIGNYSVNLTVTNNQGSFSTLKPNYITVLPVAPVANFSATPVLGTLPFNVSFSDTSTGTPTSWSWDFGDGATNNSQNPTYQYTTYGLFTVTLTATNAVGSNTTIKTGYITVNPPIASGLPIASFTQNATISGYPLTVQFVDTSITNTNSDTPTYLWNFGDGNTSTLQNPIHVYTLPGLYNATLNVTNMAGSNISSQIIRIDVSSVTTLISPLSQASIDNMKIVNINSTVISGGTSSLFSSVTSSISSGYSLMALCILIIGAVGILRYLDYL
jgi:PKD repeat protein